MAIRYKLAPKGIIYDVLRKLRDSDLSEGEIADAIIEALEDNNFYITEDEN